MMMDLDVGWQVSQTIDEMLSMVLLKEDSGILRCYTVAIDEIINAPETRNAFVFMVKQ